MTSLNATSDTVSTIDADALIVGYDGDVTSHPQLPEDVRAAIASSASALEPSGKVGSTVVLPGTDVSATRIVVVGVGDGSEGDLRLAAGAASRACGKRPASVVVALPAADDAHASAIAEGALLGAYTFNDYKSDDAVAGYQGADWHVAGASDAAITRASILAAAVSGTRDLVNTPPLDMYPAAVAEAAQAYAQQFPIDVEVWDVPELAEQGFGGILGVGMGSSRLPRLVKVEWAPEGATSSVALVGKGITFDTGGISLKPPKGMETMKSDMSGAAAVLHIVIAAARAELPVKVTGWLCLAENMPSGTAQRPSDVIRIYGGKTVEVLNTDAEGRLVMADGLVRAIEDNPDVVLDIATLTGAQGVALGSRTSGVMGADEIRAEVVAAADSVDEAFWPMPLPAHLRDSLDSKVADLKNIGDPMGGMLSAGVFLQEFVGDTPWAHLDIARPAFNEGSPWGFNPSGATGASVRTMFRFLENRAGL
ncbi:leucyl aminopeptidase [Demequina activiva]|uniref:Probable cytosol aminopeptidase n=1 Tax=Demequina activiva TaxID=1582364 RepID=A0A919Q4B2_9MICO|nr:leucyl aminopeptidase [Demequina activiva]GIG55576.1 putative cytosol aminopeptidase [Demequina activiva]